MAGPAATEAGSGLVIETCGVLAPQAGGGDGLRPARLVRPGEVLGPGDKGLGCRFLATGEPKGGTVLVELRLSRPALGGGEAVDRWFVAARRGEVALADHIFASPDEATPGPWRLEFYRDGQLAAERRFAITAGPETAAPNDSATAPPAPDQNTAASVPQTASAPEAETEADLEVVPAPEPSPDRPAPPDGPTGPTAPAVTEMPAATLPAVTSPKASGRETAAPPPKAPPRPTANNSARTGNAPDKAAEAARPATPPRDQAPQTTPASGYYAWQTGLYADADNAESQAARLRSRGFPACVVTEQGTGGRRYRVLAGRFGDRGGALALRTEVGKAAGTGTVLYHVDPTTTAKLRCH